MQDFTWLLDFGFLVLAFVVSVFMGFAAVCLGQGQSLQEIWLELTESWPRDDRGVE